MKKLVTILMAMVLVLGLAACDSGTDDTTSTESGETNGSETGTGGETTNLKIGLAVQTLSNQVWAQQAEAIKAAAQEDGNEVIVVDANENANTQIDQLENFITTEVDAIIVNPVDPQAIEETCKQARDAGIVVFSWDEEMENSDINWLIDNYTLGEEIGTQAANWIDEKFGDEAVEVVVLGYPQTPILKQREDGIIAKLNELAPNAEIVANQPAIDTTQGLNAMETILQSNPDVKVVCTIGGGGATGANEALKGYYGSEVPDDVGIFSTDLTDEAVASMRNGEFNRVVIAITGNAKVCGETAYYLLMDKVSGEDMEKNIYRELIPVTPENVDEMMEQ